MARQSQKRLATAALFALFAAMASAASAADGQIMIENFQNPAHEWTTINDPVMGGKSSSSVEIEDGVAKFDGEVAVVPALNAPGFIQMIKRGDAFGEFPDVSGCTALQLNIMAAEPYAGYRVSFGNVHLPQGRHAYGYKADFTAPVGEFDNVFVPFTDFSAKWDEATGNTIVSCQENKDYCPDEATLQDMQTIAIWGEGVAGSVRLSVKSISAVGCSGEAPASVLNGSSNDEKASNAESVMSASATMIPNEILDNPSLASSVSESTDKVLSSEKEARVPENMLLMPESKISLESLEDPSLVSSTSETSDKVLSAKKAEKAPVAAAENIALVPASEISIEATESTDKVLSEQKVPVANNVVLAPELPAESLINQSPASSVSESAEKMSSEENLPVAENGILAPASEISIESLSNPSLDSSVDESAEKVWNAENVVPVPPSKISTESFENPHESTGKAPNAKIIISPPESEISAESFARNDGPENIPSVPVSIASSPALTGIGSVASSDEGESMYAMARDNSSHSVTAVGGVVGFAAFLSLALLNRARSRGGTYIVVGGPMASADEAV